VPNGSLLPFNQFAGYNLPRGQVSRKTSHAKPAVAVARRSKPVDRSAKEEGSSQRQKDYSIVPLAVVTAFGKQKDILDDRANQVPITYDEYAAHRFAPADATIGKVGHGSDIVSQESTVMFRSPRKHVWIICPIKPDILNPNDIDMGSARRQSAQNVVIEILVREESKHGVL